MDLASPADLFAGADDITKKREPGIEIIERTPQSLIIITAVHKFSASHDGPRKSDFLTAVPAKTERFLCGL